MSWSALMMPMSSHRWCRWCFIGDTSICIACLRFYTELNEIESIHIWLIEYRWKHKKGRRPFDLWRWPLNWINTHAKKTCRWCISSLEQRSSDTQNYLPLIDWLLEVTDLELLRLIRLFKLLMKASTTVRPQAQRDVWHRESNVCALGVAYPAWLYQSEHALCPQSTVILSETALSSQRTFKHTIRAVLKAFRLTPTWVIM